MNTQRFTVSGKWPFPMDMLRYDRAAAATPEDEAKIRALTREHCDDRGSMHERHSIDLVIADAGRRTGPCEERWDSFGWQVENGDLAARAADRRASEERKALRDSAMAKLTPQEREAIRWYNGR